VRKQLRCCDYGHFFWVFVVSGYLVFDFRTRLEDFEANVETRLDSLEEKIKGIAAGLASSKSDLENIQFMLADSKVDSALCQRTLRKCYDEKV